MAQRHDRSISHRAKLTPTKDTLTALKSDVNLKSACLELCDNALDAWKRTSNRRDSMSIDIFVQEEDTTTSLIIRDNAGGVPKEDAAMLFGLGHTAKAHIPGSIGTYGVGAKKSLVNLGVPFRISSRTDDAEVGWTYRISESWFEDDKDWSVPVAERPDIEPGVTEIRIEDLNYEWTVDTAALLRERLGEAYNLFLCDELKQINETNYDLSIQVDGELVEPEGVPDWSFSPFDGIHPRQFRNIEISTPEMNSTVTVDITVGLLTKKNSQNAGTDIYCQKRKVASALRNEQGGFGTGTDHLGNFSSRHERLKVIIELETTGDGQRLPWDTQKSSIDTHNPIMRGTSASRGVYNWVRRTVQGYYDLDADKIPTAFVAPFDGDSEFAFNDGRPVQVDYSDRKRVVSNHRPDTDLPQISAIKQTATAHAKLQIDGRSTLDPREVPAYEAQLSQESTRKLENLTSVTELPPDDVIENPHQAAGRINELARIHLEHGVYSPDELAGWQRPRYQEYMERHEKDIPQRQDEVLNDLPRTPGEIDTGLEAVTVDNAAENAPSHVHTGRKIDEDAVEQETAELFLVLGAESNNERGAKVLDLSRPELCRLLGLETDVVDEVLWETLEMRFESLVERTSAET